MSGPAPTQLDVAAPEVSGDGVDEAAIMNALRGVIDPELGDNVVDLGMVKRLERSADGVLHVTIALTTAGCPPTGPAHARREGAGRFAAGHRCRQDPLR